MDAFDIAVLQATGQIRNNDIRIGNFTSSKIGKLCSNGRSNGSVGEPFYTYIEQKNFERRLGRAIDKDVNSFNTVWGKLCELYIAQSQKLPEGWTTCGQITIAHPDYDYWKGSPDADNEKADMVGEIKCPATLLSFCQMYDAFEGGLTETDQIARFRGCNREAEIYFWQMVSNAILKGRNHAALILFCPYDSEIEAIKELASSAGMNIPRVLYAMDGELPSIKDGGNFRNLSIFPFEVKEDYKEFLIKRVELAKGHLTEW